jgi:hypothetical protein
MADDAYTAIERDGVWGVYAGWPAPSGVPAHIESAASGQWTAIGGNQLQDVAFSYTVSPWPISQYSTILRSIMDDWSGATYDPVTHRFFVHGGGHSTVSGYSGNEVYVFNLSTALWTRLDNPSPYNETQANGVGVFPDGGPTPIHTYCSWCVNPTTGKVYRLGRSGSTIAQVYEFNTAAAAQLTPGATKSYWVARGTFPYSDPYGMGSAWLPDEGQFLIATHLGGSQIQISRYNPTTNAFTSGPTGESAGLDKSMGYSQARRLALIHRLNDGRYAVFNTATNALTYVTLTGATLPSRVSMEFDPVRDRFVAYTDEQADTRKLYSINPDTWAVTEIAPTTGATPPSSQGNGLMGRFRYCAEYDVFVMSNRVNGSVHLYKPAGWVAP